MDQLAGVQLGFVIGAIPSVCMATASLLLSNIEVGAITESKLQYFASGLIIAAVAAELFPLMLEDVKSSDAMVGITVGFATGLLVVYGMEWVLSTFEDSEEGDSHGDAGSCDASMLKSFSSFAGNYGATVENVSVPGSSSSNHGSDGDLELPNAVRFDNVAPPSKRMMTAMIPAEDVETVQELQSYKPLGSEQQGDWNEDDLQKAQQAILNPQHRHHVQEHLEEISMAVQGMVDKSVTLMDDTTRSVREQEFLAESIDEGVHKLQYLLDHTRRLIEGAESEITGVSAKLWLTEDRKRTMRRRVIALRYSALHLMEHITEERIDVDILKEIHAHMDEMDKQITFFHDSVQKAASKWGKKAHTLPDPDLGDVIPMALVVPVTLDCFVDGFLIGVTCTLSPKAGIILGAANCLEMGSLGMAYAVRLKKCTGTKPLIRYAALYLPCLIMFLASGLGAELADAAHAVPAVFIGFVAFGVVCLLALVCNELLIEAKVAGTTDGQWYPSLFIFLAVWLVLIIDLAVPTG